MKYLYEKEYGDMIFTVYQTPAYYYYITFQNDDMDGSLYVGPSEDLFTDVENGDVEAMYNYIFKSGQSHIETLNLT